MIEPAVSLYSRNEQYNIGRLDSQTEILRSVDVQTPAIYNTKWDTMLSPSLRLSQSLRRQLPR